MCAEPRLRTKLISSEAFVEFVAYAEYNYFQYITIPSTQLVRQTTDLPVAFARRLYIFVSDTQQSVIFARASNGIWFTRPRLSHPAAKFSPPLSLLKQLRRFPNSPWLKSKIRETDFLIL